LLKKTFIFLVITLTVFVSITGCTPTDTANSTSVSTQNTQPKISYTLSNKTANVTLEVTGNATIPATFMENNRLKEENI